MSSVNGVDKKGNQKQAFVVKHGLEVQAVTIAEVEDAVKEGQAYQFYTGVIAITGTDKQAVLYIKNSDVEDIMLTSVTMGSGESTGGTNTEYLIESVGNLKDTDDIVINGTDGLVTNRNGGNPRPFVGLAKVGPNTAAVDGVSVTGVLEKTNTSVTFNLTTIVPKGGSASIEITPPAGNTTINATLVLNFHVLEEE